jgi:hypothetical protein
MILLWSDDTTYHIVPLYSCNNNTLKMAAIAAETYWCEIVIKIHNKY